MCVFRQWYFETRNLGAAEVPSNVCSGQSITRSSWSPEVTIGLPGSDFPRSIFRFLYSIVVNTRFITPLFSQFGTLPLLFVVRSSDLLLLMYIYHSPRSLSVLATTNGSRISKKLSSFFSFSFLFSFFPSIPLYPSLSSCFLFCVLRYPPQLY